MMDDSFTEPFKSKWETRIPFTPKFLTMLFPNNKIIVYT